MNSPCCIIIFLHFVLSISDYIYSNHYAGYVAQTQTTHVASDVPSTFFSKPAISEKASLGGKASLQPKRAPITQEEINAIMVSNISFAVLDMKY